MQDIALESVKISIYFVSKFNVLSKFRFRFQLSENYFNIKN
jgi:hypothetical protein